MRIDQKITLLSEITIVVGILGFALLVWTPTTDGGVFACVVLLVTLVIMAIILFARKKKITIQYP